MSKVLIGNETPYKPKRKPIKPSRRDRQARYFLRKLIEARQTIRVIETVDYLHDKYEDAWQRLATEGTNDD